MSASDSVLVQVMLQVLVSVLVPVLTAGMIGLVGVGIRFVRSKLTAQQLAIADQLVRSFALAAEQYDLGGVVKRNGKEKKAWVVEMTQAALAKRGIQIDVGMLMDLTEAAVLSEVKKAQWNEPDMLLITPGEEKMAQAITAAEPAKKLPSSGGDHLPGTGKKPGPVKPE